MNRRIVAVWMVFLIMVSSIIILVEIASNIAGTTIYVDDDYIIEDPTHKKTIQAAVDAANPGDTVYVYSGNYVENVVINKMINLTGEDMNTTIIDGGGSGDVVTVNALRVNITGFTITGGGPTFGFAGIKLQTGKYCKITQNNVTSNGYYGIFLMGSSDYNEIRENTFYDNFFGIDFIGASHNILSNNNVTGNYWGLRIALNSSENIFDGNVIYFNTDEGFLNSLSYNNVISNNSFISNGLYLVGLEPLQFTSQKIPANNYVNGKPLLFYKNESGEIIDGMDIGQLILANCSEFTIKNLHISNTDRAIHLAYSSNFHLENNTLLENNGGGIWLYSSANNDILHNNVIDSYQGIHLEESPSNNVTFNNVTLNIYGITIDESFNNTIAENDIRYNSYGIAIYTGAHNNVVKYNYISSNSLRGISITSSSDNNSIHHNNFINNTDHAQLETATCVNNTWYDGISQGNYWSDYGGVDDGSGGRIEGDGVGDTEIPHPFTDQGQGYYQLDNFPLMNPVGNYLFVHYGWNLISIPMIQQNSSMTSVLQSIIGKYAAVQLYNSSDKADPWKHNHVFKSTPLNDLQMLHHKLGFWIYITDPNGTYFKYDGIQMVQNQTVTLYPGWNLVGYPSLTRYNRTTGLNNLTFGTDVDAIQWYDASTETWYDMGPNDYFVPCRGYWIHAITNCEWEVPL